MCPCSPLFKPPRAFYSLRKCGIEADDVRMAVCVMRVVPARYAFVIHTKNPSNNDANEVCEGCVLGGGMCMFACRPVAPPAPEYALADESSPAQRGGCLDVSARGCAVTPAPTPCAWVDPASVCLVLVSVCVRSQSHLPVASPTKQLSHAFSGYWIHVQAVTRPSPFLPNFMCQQPSPLPPLPPTTNNPPSPPGVL